MKPMAIFLATIAVILSATEAQAYIGPGLGGGTLTVVLGFVASIFLAIFAVVWYPIKRILRKLKSGEKKTAEKEETQS